jgi:hypothetical protein
MNAVASKQPRNHLQRDDDDTKGRNEDKGVEKCLIHNKILCAAIYVCVGSFSGLNFFFYKSRC